jgi:hypothetical protein
MGDTSAGVLGYQAAFEQVFREIYKLPGCILAPYFDDVQIQHVPKFAYGEEIAVLGEETSDRFSMTRSFQRFTQRLIDEKLPWEGAGSVPDEDAQSEEVLEQGHRSASDRAAGAVLRELDRVTDELTLSAKRYSLVSSALDGSSMAALVLLLVWLGLATESPKRLFVIAIVAFALLLHVGKTLSRLQQKTAVTSEVLRELRTARAAFEAGDAPYSGPDALLRLRTRLDQLTRAIETILRSQSRPRHTRVYISYRRADSGATAGRLYDRLASAIGGDKVFVDTDSIKPGDDFRQALNSLVAEASVMLVIIGPKWLVAADASGRRRIDDPNDFVRLEIASALERNILVIPVLVDGARMPRAKELPLELTTLAHRNALELSTRRWEFDVTQLLRVIQPDATQ